MLREPAINNFIKSAFLLRHSCVKIYLYYNMTV
nr:MAG TPA: hypothetical protein [Caudoviricetes sp.]